MIPLSDRARAICRTYWRTRPGGGPAATCCAGCPLAQPCGAQTAGTREAIDAHTAALNAAAESVP